MSEQPKFNAAGTTGFEQKSMEQCANMGTSSLYKMQLGVNSVKDELKNITLVLTAILEQIEKSNEKKE